MSTTYTQEINLDKDFDFIPNVDCLHIVIKSGKKVVETIVFELKPTFRIIPETEGGNC